MKKTSPILIESTQYTVRDGGPKNLNWMGVSTSFSCYERNDELLWDKIKDTLNDCGENTRYVNHILSFTDTVISEEVKLEECLIDYYPTRKGMFEITIKKIRKDHLVTIYYEN
jgi:hypothetical protein